ncbi:proteoglycan 4 [Boleophthalmus pectinirostris]|uniref:proteoglycan 4 n=1 Tax=Boleophthalmus pectinirostris TaxID=150288 RepID=UPI002432DEA9|nr:proteoglycan 4 [Boleophthalmus pectinirostris]
MHKLLNCDDSGAQQSAPKGCWTRHPPPPWTGAPRASPRVSALPLKAAVSNKEKVKARRHVSSLHTPNPLCAILLRLSQRLQAPGSSIHRCIHQCVLRSSASAPRRHRAHAPTGRMIEVRAPEMPGLSMETTSDPCSPRSDDDGSSDRGWHPRVDRRSSRRLRNRDAARKSRQKTTERADELHQELQCLERDNSSLQRDIAALKKDRDYYTSLLETHAPHCCLTCTSTDTEDSCVGLSAGSVTVPATVAQPVPATVPQPVPATVPQPVPATVPQPVPATVPQPVPATVPQPVPATVQQPVPATVQQPVPVTVQQPVPVTVQKPVPVTVQQPVLTTVHKPVPASVPTCVLQTVFTTVHLSVPTTLQKSISVPVHQSIPATVHRPVSTNVRQHVHQPVPAPVPNTVCTNIHTRVSASVPSTALTYVPTAICTAVSNCVPTTASPHISTHLPITVFDSITTSVPTNVPIHVPVSAHVHTSASFPNVCPFPSSSTPEMSYSVPVPPYSPLSLPSTSNLDQQTSSNVPWLGPPCPTVPVPTHIHQTSPTGNKIMDRSACLGAPVTEAFTALSTVHPWSLVPPVSSGPSLSLAPQLTHDLLTPGPVDSPLSSNILDMSQFDDNLVQFLEEYEWIWNI